MKIVDIAAVKLSLRKNRVFLVYLIVVLALAFFVLAYFQPQKGIELNKYAWQSSYLERGLELPKSGPRDGYWGSRLKSKKVDSELGWIESQQEVGDLIKTNPQGLQTVSIPSQTNDSSYKIFILGGSVAWGAYASTYSDTYFYRLAKNLEKENIASDINVFAAGAWKSSQELIALERMSPEIKPDLVVFFNGLNDLTNGARAETYYREKVPTPKGVKWTALYHEHDYQERVERYLANMSRAAKYCMERGIELLIVLQPSLFEKQELTSVEKKLLAPSLAPHKSIEVFRASYQKMRTGLKLLSQNNQHVRFLDLSTCFELEQHTVFADMWHFTDPGQKVVADKLLSEITSLVKKQG